MPDKPEILPLRIVNLKGSAAWKYSDYKFCWYMKLLIESCDSERPGYLVNDIDVLWGLAGARTRRYFETAGGLDILALHFRRTEDGRFVYNPRLVAILQGKAATPTKQRRSIVRVKLSISDDLSVPIYEQYPKKIKRKTALIAIAKAIRKVSETKHLSDAEAAKFICEAVAEYAKSPAGKRGTYTPHCATWMNAEQYLDDREEWYELDREEFEKATKANGAAVGSSQWFARADKA